MIEYEELEMLIIASIETLKQQRMKCGIDKVFELVQDSLEENISWESFDKTLQFLIDGDSVKSNSFSNKVYLSIPKNDTCRDAFNIKEELQSSRNELFEELTVSHRHFCGNKLCVSILTKRPSGTKHKLSIKYCFIWHWYWRRI